MRSNQERTWTSSTTSTLQTPRPSLSTPTTSFPSLSHRISQPRPPSRHAVHAAAAPSSPRHPLRLPRAQFKHEHSSFRATSKTTQTTTTTTTP